MDGKAGGNVFCIFDQTYFFLRRGIRARTLFGPMLLVSGLKLAKCVSRPPMMTVRAMSFSDAPPSAGQIRVHTYRRVIDEAQNMVLIGGTGEDQSLRISCSSAHHCRGTGETSFAAPPVVPSGDIGTTFAYFGSLSPRRANVSGRLTGQGVTQTIHQPISCTTGGRSTPCQHIDNLKPS
jgi:hypothetical protein